MGMHQQHCLRLDSLTTPPGCPTSSNRRLSMAAACAGLLDNKEPDRQENRAIPFDHVGDINLHPSGNAFGTVVHATERSNIDTIIIGGRIVKQHGKVLGVDSTPPSRRVDDREHLPCRRRV